MAMQTRQFPRGYGDTISIDAPVRTAHWLADDLVRSALGHGNALPKGRSPIIMGQLGEGADRSIIAHDDDRSAVVVAGSRGNKGVSILMPNLLSYPGSVIVTDPKGELALTTARYRRDVLKQNVIILDPFNVLAMYGCFDLPTGRYNPLEWIERFDREFVDEVAMLTDALIIKEPRDVHFPEVSRILLKAVVLQLLCGGFGDLPCDLTTVRQLVMEGENGGGLNALLAKLVTSQDAGGAIARSASMIFHMGDREFGSVISTTGRNTEFIDSPSMRDVLSGRSSFDPRKIKSEPTSIYLVLPEWRLSSHSRWLRLMIISLLSHLQRSPAEPDMPHIALILDEFASLGYMEPIERAVSYIAGFGVKIVTVVQDLNQLVALYGNRWQTFVANAGVIMAFSNADTMTAEYLSKRCGETEIMRLEQNISNSHNKGTSQASFFQKIQAALGGQDPAQIGAHTQQSASSRSSSINPRRISAPLLTPDEVMVHFARETGDMLVLINGARPISLRRIRYFDDPLFRDLASPNPLHPASRL